MDTTNDTRTQEEYDGLKNDKATYEYQASIKEDSVADLKYKLERLDEAYIRIKDLKQTLEEYRDIKLNKCYEKYNNEYDNKWLGTNYLYVESNIYDVVMPSFSSYIDNVDEILDGIGNLITEYENKIIDETTILSELLITINTIWDKIKNYWN